MVLQPQLSLGEVVLLLLENRAVCLGRCGCLEKAVEDHCSRLALGTLCRVLSLLSSLGDLWGPQRWPGDCRRKAVCPII